MIMPKPANTVEITMEGIEEKTVTVDTFSYTNVPSGLYAEVQDTLDVRLWGLSEELAELKADAITATVDLSSVTETGSCRVPVTVTVSGYRDVAEGQLRGDGVCHRHAARA